MELFSKGFINLLVCIFVCLTVSGCVVGGPKVWPKIEGVVLDKDTGGAIEGAFITIYYKGEYYYVIESQDVCYDMQVVKTDEKGKFTVKTQFEFLNRAFDREIMDVRIYKPGLMVEFMPDEFTDTSNIYMRKSDESVLERMSSIMADSVAGRCGTDGKVGPIQDEMYRQGYGEALSLANNNEEIERLRYLRYEIASAWDAKSESLSPNEAERIFSEKYKDLYGMTPHIEKPVPQVIIIEQQDQFTGSPLR